MIPTIELVAGTRDEQQEYHRMAEKDDSNELPEGFVPSDLDVICGWARQNYHHSKRCCQA